MMCSIAAAVRIDSDSGSRDEEKVKCGIVFDIRVQPLSTLSTTEVELFTKSPLVMDPVKAFWTDGIYNKN
jgi:hypothetical protein